MSGIVWLLPVSVALLVIAVAIILVQGATITRLQRNADYYRRTYLRKQGFSSTFGSYDIRSFDGGVTWYAVEYNPETEGLEIVGLAEDVHPGLSKHVKGLDTLITYVHKNGPIGEKGYLKDADIRVLTGAGFTIQEPK